MKNIQVLDGVVNATYRIFQATDEEFTTIFSAPGQDIEFIEDFFARTEEGTARNILGHLWKRPILKRDAMGIYLPADRMTGA
jgi:hypothetical protein